MRHPQLTPAGLTVYGIPKACLAIDVLFDGRRIWTVEVAELEPGRKNHLPWPDALRPHLLGHTFATVADSATGASMWQGQLRFSDSPEKTSVERSDGAPLSVNKWGLLAPDLANMHEEVIASLLSETQTLMDFLRERSKRPFVVGGTLLGAVRAGALLPHDDDVDVAFLSEHTNPTLVGAETLALAHELRAAGYELIEHSAAHLQVVFRDDFELPSYHIDVFAAFFTEDGHINQPFHVRGPFAVEQMLPFSTVSLHGVSFPAPADVESWLVINYDENWRTPIPGFKLETPEATVRRFNNWFGGFNFKREFWDAWFTSSANIAASPWSMGQSWLERQPLTTRLIVDIGCGSGALTRALAKRHPDQMAHGADFSEQALNQARDDTPGSLTNVSFGNENLNMLAVILAARRTQHSGAFDVVSNHVLEQVSHRARTNMLRLMRLALRSGGRAYATAYASFASDVSPDDPTTWHLEQGALATEAAGMGMVAGFEELLPARGEASRGPYGVTFTLAPEPLPSAQLPQKAGSSLRFASRIKSLLGRVSRRPKVNLQAEVAELRLEIDELRHNSLRVAEILDLLESTLTTTPEQKQP